MYPIIKHCIHIMTAATIVLTLAANFTVTAETRTVNAKDIEVDAEGSAAIIESDKSAARKTAINEALADAIQQVMGVYVESEMRGESYEVTYKRLTTISSGFAYLVKVISEDESDAIYTVKARVRVRTIPLVNELAKAGLTRKWRIVVVIPESHINRVVPDPAAEAIITQALIEMKYQLKDQTLAAKVRNSDEVAKAAHGDIDAIKMLFAKTKADILVVGEAFSQGATQFQGMQSCRARVEVKAILRDSGNIISSRTAMESGIDLTEIMAGKTALEKAGASVSKRLIEDISTLVGTNDLTLEVTINSLSDIATLKKLENAIRQMPGVKELDRVEYESGVAICTVTVSSNLLDMLQERIEGLASPRVSVMGASRNAMQLRIIENK